MKGATGAQWAVLYALYLHSNERGEAYPSISTIGEVAGVARSTVTRSLNELEGIMGLRRERHGHGPKGVTHYLLPVRCKAAPKTEQIGAQPHVDRCDPEPLIGAQPHPEQCLEHVKEQRGDSEPTEASQAIREKIHELIGDWS